MQSANPPPDRLMTLPQVAQYLQMKKRTIYQWAKSGKIPSFKLGNVWRFRRAELDHWIEEQRRNTPRSHTES
jgi:nitrogen PTS system EIIA component